MCGRRTAGEASEAVRVAATHQKQQRERIGSWRSPGTEPKTVKEIQKEKRFFFLLPTQRKQLKFRIHKRETQTCPHRLVGDSCLFPPIGGGPFFVVFLTLQPNVRHYASE